MEYTSKGREETYKCLEEDLEDLLAMHKELSIILANIDTNSAILITSATLNVLKITLAVVIDEMLHRKNIAIQRSNN